VEERAVRVCIVQPNLNAVSETFIRAHAERLPADVTVVHRDGLIPVIGNEPALSQSISSRAFRKASRLLAGKSWDWEITSGYLQAFRKARAEVVLAEYGPTGVAVMPACEIAGIPLVVHFHGYDASKTDVLNSYRASYRELFGNAAAVVAVSTAMRNRLLEIGAEPQRTHLNVYGIDCRRFGGGSADKSPPTFIAVGRFVEKKAPYLTILAFANVVRQCPEARLRMTGDGILLGPCKDLAVALGISEFVTFLGAQPHDVVSWEMKQARAFVQHSIEAADGDCEGTPLAVLEAGATGLPVVSTRHAGIPDVVADGNTGFLVNERDVAGMADRMLRLATDPALAGRMGADGRQRVSTQFTMERSIAGLYDILSGAVECQRSNGNHRTRYRAPSGNHAK
jgi:glycosyltransferase involved in cell wall biosynthesis